MTGEPVRYEGLCKTSGCPHPSDPDFHVPICGHGLAYEHHHTKKRSRGGALSVQVCICPNCHHKIDNGRWMDGVYDHDDGTVHYFIKDIKGEERCDEPIGRWKEEEPPDDAAYFQAHKDDPDEWEDEPTPARVTLPAVPSAQDAVKTAKEEWKPAKEADVEYNEVGLRLADNLTREQWEGIMGTIQQMVVSVPWWVGDALVYGQRFGEEMWQAIKDKGGADYEKLRKYMWVAERVPIGTRVPTLKWSHHREVADLEPDLQREWLQRAQDENLGANALRVAIKGEEPETCPEHEDGHHFVCACGKER